MPEVDGKGNWGASSIVLLLAIGAVLVGAGVAVGAAVWAGGTTTSTSKPTASNTATASVRVVARFPPPRAASFLFSEVAAGGSLTGSSDSSLTLTLRGLRGYVTRFTDTPVRDAAIASNTDFFARWPARFAQTPPNAVLSYAAKGQAQPVTIVLTLSHPRYDAAGGWVSYQAVRIRKLVDALAGTRARLTPPLIPNPASFAQATLFIDNAGASLAANAECSSSAIRSVKTAASSAASCSGNAAANAAATRLRGKSASQACEAHGQTIRSSKTSAVRNRSGRRAIGGC